MSTVSVIIPCYNYGRYLRQCVDSVLSQEGVDVAVLVIDDASTDGSAQVVAALEHRDPRVRVICHERNMGHIATYNEGIEWADGDYLLLLSADDYLTPGSLSRAAALMDAYPNVGLVYGQAPSLWDDETLARPLTSSAGARVIRGHEWIGARCQQMNNVVATATAVVRTALQHRLGGYRADCPYAGDLEMWLRLAAYADVGELKADQAVYRQHGGNMSVEWFSALLPANFKESRRAYETVLTEHATAIPDAPVLLRVVRRQVARRALRMATNRYCRGQFDRRTVGWLESHASDVYPRCTDLPEWWTLQACKCAGPRAAAYIGPVADVVRRNARRARGVYSRSGFRFGAAEPGDREQDDTSSGRRINSGSVDGVQVK
jgi:glycosyltransferase involved in cell wall biosynthesis